MSGDHSRDERLPARFVDRVKLQKFANVATFGSDRRRRGGVQQGHVLRRGRHDLEALRLRSFAKVGEIDAVHPNAPIHEGREILSVRDENIDLPHPTGNPQALIVCALDQLLDNAVKLHPHGIHPAGGDILGVDCVRSRQIPRRKHGDGGIDDAGTKGALVGDSRDDHLRTGLKVGRTPWHHRDVDRSGRILNEEVGVNLSDMGGGAEQPHGNRRGGRLGSQLTNLLGGMQKMEIVRLASRRQIR